MAKLTAARCPLPFRAELFSRIADVSYQLQDDMAKRVFHRL
jgi:hypothetical protein